LFVKTPLNSGLLMRSASLLFLIVFHSLLASFAVGVVVFYIFPHDFYFATPAYALTFLIFFATNYVLPAGARFLPFKDTYIRALVLQPALSWMITCAIFGAAMTWSFVMFDTIYARFAYMKAMDEALISIGVDGLSVPEPTLLAKAFNAAPARPEVPFILTRASRLLSIDVLRPVFYEYNKAFLGSVDKSAVIAKFKEHVSKHRLAIGNESSNLPKIDPIRFLANVAFETNVAAEQTWAIETLAKYRANDDAARLQLDIWRAQVATTTDDKAFVTTLGGHVDAISSAGFSSVSLITDAVFQTALDQIAGTTISLEAKAATADEKRAYQNDIISNYERIILLRRRLVNATDLIWWEPPGKLFIYYIYLHLGGQTMNIGGRVIDEIAASPELKERLQKLYNAPAFRAFQNPETWALGTPLSPAFNGAAGVTKIREWLKMGW